MFGEPAWTRSSWISQRSKDTSDSGIDSPSPPLEFKEFANSSKVGWKKGMEDHEKIRPKWDSICGDTDSEGHGAPNGNFKASKTSGEYFFDGDNDDDIPLEDEFDLVSEDDDEEDEHDTEDDEEESEESGEWDHEMKVCTKCGTTKTPLWRMGPEGPKTLCNACGVSWSRTNRNKGNKRKKKMKKLSGHVKREREIIDEFFVEEFYMPDDDDPKDQDEDFTAYKRKKESNEPHHTSLPSIPATRKRKPSQFLDESYAAYSEDSDGDSNYGLRYKNQRITEEYADSSQRMPSFAKQYAQYKDHEIKKLMIEIEGLKNEVRYKDSIIRRLVHERKEARKNRNTNTNGANQINPNTSNEVPEDLLLVTETLAQMLEVQETNRK